MTMTETPSGPVTPLTTVSEQKVEDPHTIHENIGYNQYLVARQEIVRSLNSARRLSSLPSLRHNEEAQKKFQFITYLIDLALLEAHGIQENPEG